MEEINLTVLGSGGATPTPRPFCQCEICDKARRLGEPYKRNSCSLFIDEINTVIDCGEDIADSLNRRNIVSVDSLFITHWHPDHTFGLRPLLEANFDFETQKAKKTIDVYIPKKVFERLKLEFSAVTYMFDIQKIGKLHLVEDGDVIELGSVSIEVVGYDGKESDTYAYLISKEEKKVLYAACDTEDFVNYKNFHNLDLLINECGLFSNDDSEISFKNLISRIKETKPKKTILTHIEESEIRIQGDGCLDRMKEKYADVTFDFASDGMRIVV